MLYCSVCMCMFKMSLIHKLPENVNRTLIYQRISAGQAILFPWDKTTTQTRNLVRAYANSLGCPEEYILCALLTVNASFIGTHRRIHINDSWEEPAIVWFNVCAKKGQNKTAALKVLARPMREIEQELQTGFKQRSASFAGWPFLFRKIAPSHVRKQQQGSWYIWWTNSVLQHAWPLQDKLYNGQKNTAGTQWRSAMHKRF